LRWGELRTRGRGEKSEVSVRSYDERNTTRKKKKKYKVVRIIMNQLRLNRDNGRERHAL
jgi:hypothetical protein